MHNHDSRIPVSKGFDESGSGVSMAKNLDCDHVHRVGELRILQLAAIELGIGGEGVDQDQRRLILTIRLSHAVGDIDAAQVVDVDSLRHTGID